MKRKRDEIEIAFARKQGRRLYELRNERHITRHQLADQTGIHQAMIFRIEMGDAMASAYQIDILARAMDIEREDLYPSSQVLPMTVSISDFPMRRVYA